MRVLLINNHHEVGGGSERVYRETGRLLEQHGHQVAYVSVVQPGEPLEKVEGLFLADEGYRPLRPDRFIYKADVGRKLASFMEQWKPDIAHLHIFYGRLTSAVLRPLRDQQVPTVMSVHEYRLLCPTYTMLDGKGKICERCASGAYWHAVTNRCNKASVAASAIAAVECIVRDKVFDYLEYVDRFLFVSEFCRDLHLRHRPAMSVKATVLHNFVQVERAFSRKDCGSYLLYAGRLSREKGLATLLTAVSKVPGVGLRIAGDGPERGLLEALARELGIDTRVQFLGRLPANDLNIEIAGARWVLVPSEWYENFPMATLEAFALGVPVIGARIGGIPELVRQGETGLLFEPGSSGELADVLLASMRLSDEEVLQMGVRARELVGDLCGPDRHYSELMRNYEVAASARRSDARRAL